MKNNPQGFTLIELLVVISIIALLSSVVLSSLNSARVKAADSAVKAGMKQIALQTENYRDTNGNFGGANLSSCSSGVFNDAIIQQQRAYVLSNALAGATMSCYTDSTGTKWAVSVSDLRSVGTNPLCIDNSGAFKSSTAQSTGVCQ